MAALLDNRTSPLKREQKKQFIVSSSSLFTFSHRATFSACGVPEPVDPLSLANVARFRVRQGGVPAALHVVSRHLFAAREPLLEILNALLNIF